MEDSCDVLTQRMFADLQDRGLGDLASGQCSLDAVRTLGDAFLLILNRGETAPPALIGYVPSPPDDPHYLITLIGKRTEWGQVIDRIIAALEGRA